MQTRIIGIGQAVSAVVTCSSLHFCRRRLTILFCLPTRIVQMFENNLVRTFMRLSNHVVALRRSRLAA